MKRIAVLRGGPSTEHDVSMLTGEAVLRALEQSHHATKDVVITRNGHWLEGGRVRLPQHILLGIDAVFIALHGTYGEDGQVQKMLEQLNIPFTGSRSLASAVAFNKSVTKDIATHHNVKTPRGARVRKEDLLRERVLDSIADVFGSEVFVKPSKSGSSDGAMRAPVDGELFTQLETLFSEYDELLLEEVVTGIEATVGVIHNFRGESLYCFPVVEIVPPPEARFFDRSVKYNGTTTELVPARFPKQLKQKLTQVAQDMHQALGCHQYSRSDFIVRGHDVHYLETNTLPGFTSESLYPKAAEAVGLPFKELVLHLVETVE